MLCNRCGQTILNKSAYCKECGAAAPTSGFAGFSPETPETCAYCRSKSSGASYCRSCGSLLTVYKAAQFDPAPVSQVADSPAPEQPTIGTAQAEKSQTAPEPADGLTQSIADKLDSMKLPEEETEWYQQQVAASAQKSDETVSGPAVAIGGAAHNTADGLPGAELSQFSGWSQEETMSSFPLKPVVREKYLIAVLVGIALIITGIFMFSSGSDSGSQDDMMGYWQNGVYHNPHLGFSFTPPSGWIDALDVMVDFVDSELRINNRVVIVMTAMNENTGSHVIAMYETLRGPAARRSVESHMDDLSSEVRSTSDLQETGRGQELIGSNIWRTIDIGSPFGNMRAYLRLEGNTLYFIIVTLAKDCRTTFSNISSALRPYQS